MTSSEQSVAAPEPPATATPSQAAAEQTAPCPEGEASHLQQPTPLSKNAQKRLRKQQQWEDGREDRRLKRREKRQTHKQRVRSERAALVAGGADPRVVYGRDKHAATLVPLSIVLDCDFEAYMTDKERISLSSQVTRAYSDNRGAKYCAHLWVAGFGGKLAARFNDVLQAQQNSWKGASVFEGDFVAQENPAPWPRDAHDPFPLPDPEPPLDPALQDVVYLSSDAPYTLARLEPNTTYVVGGLVDKNREKGLCYRRARERGIRTARLPIGEYMVMQSRQVLATNHVVDIMLKWLEFEDWGKAFLSVIPKRKGGRLRGEAGEEHHADEAAEDEDETGEQAEEGQGEKADEAPKDEAATA
ncbi:tRNA m(1)G methyltransferase domain containing protein [Cordyceps militaris CM01]|uniref:tRNA (guanine(9)-N1)-methyltransferase n=1 Tax=Cordyceps militaris (strain CM01) TaxID=983644 RepID=G3J4G3_CORMM|nr:tRNA m(1)G methyltransferase domain containing protein [Cordyceps militaris CM01]EGX96680.1 tRNA m(1)G methyltransferase domain containing protein [Cordyceps militaris CM01]